MQEPLLTDTGLDRVPVVLDVQGMFPTQRAVHRMALIRTQLKTLELVLRAPGMLALHVAVDAWKAPPVPRYGRTPCPLWRQICL